MTNPVILLGTQSNGETLPVQVDQFGRLVAEGLQGSEGPPGPPGEEGPPGPQGDGVPKPYGSEGQVLTIVGGVPTWADPTAPPEDDSSLSLSFAAPWVYQDASGNAISPVPDDWQTAVKSTQNWADPLGTAKDGWSEKTVCTDACRKFDIDIQNALGQVLTIWIKVTLQPTHSFNPGPWGTLLESSNQNIVPIQNAHQFAGSAPDGSGLVGPYGAAYTFLINRDDAAGEMEYTAYGPPGGYGGNLTGMDAQVTKWTLESSQLYVLRRRDQARAQAAALREAFTEHSKKP